MPNTTSSEPSDATTNTVAANGGDAAKARFAKAIEEAKAGAHALKGEAQGKADVYREQFSAKSSEWLEEAKVRGDEAKVKATELANEGKARTSEAISSLGKIVEENAPTIDEKLGVKYGDYARTYGKQMQDAAAKLDSKEFAELGEDAKEFVRKSPGVALGIAATAGFLLARVFRRSN